MVMFVADGDDVAIENPADAVGPLELLLIAGLPLNEQVVRYGPFVMSTEEEIYQAVEDFRSGRMGAINSFGPSDWNARRAEAHLTRFSQKSIFPVPRTVSSELSWKSVVKPTGISMLQTSVWCNSLA
jgi:hypothetical protein